MTAFPKPSAPFREVELTEFEPPTRIRWAERSKNLVTAAEGGYVLAPQGRTQLTIHNVLWATASAGCSSPLALRSTQRHRWEWLVDRSSPSFLMRDIPVTT